MSSSEPSNVVKIDLYRSEGEPELEEPITYYTVQVWRAAEDLRTFALRGGAPRWENYSSSYIYPEAEDKYFEAKEIYAKVRIVQHDEGVVLGG